MPEKKRRRISKKTKIQLTVFLIVYVTIGIINVQYLPKSPSDILGNVANRWIVGTGPWYLRINPMTIIMSLVVLAVIIWFAISVHKEYSLIPTRKQAFAESLMDFVYDIVQSSIPDERFARSTFMIATTLFLYIVVSNLLGGVIPGISVDVTKTLAENGEIIRNVKFILFSDTWFAPTADLNTNLTYALMVLVISHYFGIKAKGFKAWLKSFIEPVPFLLPLNIIGELAKPISHSMRLFGNITGGGVLVLALSYFVKYMFLPPVLWGYFGIFSGLIQAFVFSTLTVAYISAQVG
ncbi:MAG TPA: F0F1 ATP synthase subunit A [Fervidobacterium sp.]|nr:F0F1 ATP synthase subunit A [Fervidobacterium sp.]HRD20249.1 F0F1 ATP synthase subunit A [Fervidobacterium sp.]